MLLVWNVEPNSMIVSPTVNEKVAGSNVEIAGWVWSGNGINEVEVGANGDMSWVPAGVTPLKEAKLAAF
jgi:hypothetical protein